MTRTGKSLAAERALAGKCLSNKFSTAKEAFGIQGTEALRATQMRVTAALEPNTPAFYSFWLKASSSIFAAGQQGAGPDI
jgi:hypothetical protein